MLNRKAYVLRYRNVDSTRIIAERALKSSLSNHYDRGTADALLNLAFYNITRMRYDVADSLLNRTDSIASNDLTRLSTEVFRMRLCQRKSLNKDFYLHKFEADKIISKYQKATSLSEWEKKEYTYARSEYGIVLSTYLYYVRLFDESSEALLQLEDENNINLINDTAQYLGYLYNIGAGGILKETNHEELLCKEFDYLMQCYMIARHNGYLFWEANALQAISEHLNDPSDLQIIKSNDAACLRYLNDDGVSDTLLAGNIAERALQGFVRYGDLYQVASAWRTLSQCYHQIGDHNAQLSCLNAAMQDSLILQTPDLVASILEKYSIAYSALNNKVESDFHRNLYLDIQDSTRQDRQLEARAYSLETMVNKTRTSMYLIVIFIIIASIGIYMIIRHGRNRNFSFSHSTILLPFKKWQEHVASITAHEDEQLEEMEEKINMLKLQCEDAIRINVEQHARISYIQGMMPLIDRMQHAVSLKDGELSDEQMAYVSDICNIILSNNMSLSKWIQLKKGQIALHVETFPLQHIFDILRLSKSSFSSHSLELIIPDTSIMLKADKVLTLFLLNTILDNARKFSPEGGKVTIETEECSDVQGYAKISVTNEGEGLTPEQVDTLFDYKPLDTTEDNLDVQKSHGFGLMNCRGIIDRYKKTSDFFSRCNIYAESKQGVSTTISFLLPTTVRQLIILCLFIFLPLISFASNESLDGGGEITHSEIIVPEAESFLDSVYAANIDARYDDSYRFADSCFHYINKEYVAHYSAKDTLKIYYNGEELNWKKAGVNINYSLLISLRNEIAVAALALNDWQMYNVNNEAYVNLYKECSQDTSLSTYCETMEEKELQYNISVVILILLILLLAYIFWKLHLSNLFLRKRSINKVNNVVSTLYNNFTDTTCHDIGAKIDATTISLNDKFMDSLSEDCKTLVHELRDSMLDIRKTISQYESSREHATSSVNLFKREYDRLYVNNNIIDNTLSALKHETMYFPSRIATLVEKGAKDEIKEMVSYYRALYAMLSAQCARNENDINYEVNKIQLSPEGPTILINKQLYTFLKLLIKRKNGNEAADMHWEPQGDKYINIFFECPNLRMTDSQQSEAFTATTHDFDFLIMKQIMRETGKATLCYASGIRIIKDDNEQNIIVLTMPKIQLTYLYVR